MSLEELLWPLSDPESLGFRARQRLGSTHMAQSESIVVEMDREPEGLEAIIVPLKGAVWMAPLLLSQSQSQMNPK